MVPMVLAALSPTPAKAGGGASCNLSATPLVFGKYLPSSNAPTDFTATISLTCTASGTTPAPIHGSITLNGTGGPFGRQLASDAHRIRYQLYLDLGRTVPWGDGGGSDAVAISGAVGPNTPFRRVVTLYGRILARQPGILVGNYADQITVILNY